MRPVLVSQRVVTDPRHGERRDALDQRWAGFLAACGLGVVPMPNHEASALGLLAAIDNCAGLVLTGGGNLGEYGGTDPERDAAERAVLGRAIERRMPVLGVCRGLQVLVQVFGGALGPIQGHVSTMHAITHDGVDRTVNSYHDFGVDRLPGEFLAAARTDDGAIEAIRHRDAPIAGVMWHPERCDVPQAPDVALFTRWFGGRAA